LGYFFHFIWSIQQQNKKVAKKDDLLPTAGSNKSKKMSHRLVKEQEDELYTWFLKKRYCQK